MLYLNQNPEAPYSTDWDRRFQDARRPWDYFESSEHVERAVIACVVSLLICTILGWLIPLLTSWIWYFFLDRVCQPPICTALISDISESRLASW
jgi:hypothetical protein